MRKNQPVARKSVRLVPNVVALAPGILVMLALSLASGSTDYLLSAVAEELGPLVLNVLLVSAPFLLLAHRGITYLLPWAVALLLTGGVWGYVISEFLSGGTDGGTSVGNSVWLALIMLGSGLVITIICHMMTRGSSEQGSGRYGA